MIRQTGSAGGDRLKSLIALRANIRLCRNQSSLPVASGFAASRSPPCCCLRAPLSAASSKRRALAAHSILIHPSSSAVTNATIPAIHEDMGGSVYVGYVNQFGFQLSWPSTASTWCDIDVLTSAASRTLARPSAICPVWPEQASSVRSHPIPSLRPM